MEAQLRKSKAKDKRYAMIFTDKQGRKKTVNFGSSNHDNYTIHHSKERQKLYLQRHIHDPHRYDTAGQLSRIILWSSPSLNQGIKNYESMHKIKVVRR